MQENETAGAALSGDEQDIERKMLGEKQSTFLDHVMAVGRIKNDAELSRLVEMSPPVISKLRNGWMPVGSTILIAINEVTDIPVREMKTALGYKILESRTKK